MGKIVGLTGKPLSAPVAANVPDILKFITDEVYAVYIVRMPTKPTLENNAAMTIMPVNQYLGAFKTQKDAIDFIRANHRVGCQYFLSKGVTIG